jgi:hypothetical protein
MTEPPGPRETPRISTTLLSSKKLISWPESNFRGSLPLQLRFRNEPRWFFRCPATVPEAKKSPDRRPRRWRSHGPAFCAANQYIEARAAGDGLAVHQNLRGDVETRATPFRIYTCTHLARRQRLHRRWQPAVSGVLSSVAGACSAAFPLEGARAVVLDDATQQRLHEAFGTDSKEAFVIRPEGLLLAPIDVEHEFDTADVIHGIVWVPTKDTCRWNRRSVSLSRKQRGLKIFGGVSAMRRMPLRTLSRPGCWPS